MFDFPSSPTNGQVSGNYTWDGEKWVISASVGGAASIAFAPTGNVAATTVQAAIAELDAEKVAKAGDTMTGHLSLPTAPAAANAVRKDYVDARVTPDNVLINGDFRVNQTGYVSGAALASGAYGHDQWKAGAAGGDYSFTQLKSSTQITIASGKSLIQPIEDANVSGGSYVLSWTGTSQARAGVNSLTPSGAYASSPLLITGQTAGTVMSVEFNVGTLGTIKLESGSTASPFIMRPYDQELMACQRYYKKFCAASGSSNYAVGLAYAVNLAIFHLRYSIMRAVPTVSLSALADFNVTDGSASLVPAGYTVHADAEQMRLDCNVGGVGITVGRAAILIPAGVNSAISLDARL